MSYCRTDGVHSDVYAYHDGTSINVHVKANERKKGYRESRSKDPSKRLEHLYAAFLPWDHPCAGQDFWGLTPREALAVMTDLKTKGVKIPKYAIKQLELEAKQA